VDTSPKSITAQDLKVWLESKVDLPIVIDVREIRELELSTFPFTDIHIPISKVSVDTVNLKLNKYSRKKFVIICHRGVRSYDFGYWLLENKFLNEVWNLEEGIDGWSRYIDQNVPRY